MKKARTRYAVPSPCLQLGRHRFLVKPACGVSGSNLSVSCVRDRTHLREHYIDRALAEGLVERTLPDKPTSRLQKYRLTAKGRAMLDSQAPKA